MEMLELKDYVKNRKSVDNKVKVQANGGEYFEVRKNCIFYDDFSTPVGIIVNKTVLVNADESEVSGYLYGYEDYVSISFRCMMRLIFDKEDLKGFIKAVNKGEIKIEDMTADKFISGSKKKNPGKGYTYLQHIKGWHISATVVFSYKTRYFILGQDEGQYFGCELADECHTISQAYTSLIPKELRRTKNLMRQGEWFAYETKKKIPTVDICLAIFSKIVLPKEKDGASHEICCNEGYIGLDGEIFAKNFSMYHPNGEHEDLSSGNNKFYNFRRNTALKSVSVEGVD